VYAFGVLGLAWGGKDCRSMSLNSVTLQMGTDPYTASLPSALKFQAPAWSICLFQCIHSCVLQSRCLIRLRTTNTLLMFWISCFRYRLAISAACFSNQHWTHGYSHTTISSIPFAVLHLVIVYYKSLLSSLPLFPSSRVRHDKLIFGRLSRINCIYIYIYIYIYTGCFTTLGHNCRRWFPRSLWSKKFI